LAHHVARLEPAYAHHRAGIEAWQQRRHGKPRQPSPADRMTPHSLPRFRPGNWRDCSRGRRRPVAFPCASRQAGDIRQGIDSMTNLLRAMGRGLALLLGALVALAILRRAWWPLGGYALLYALLLVWWSGITPGNDHAWADDVTRLLA